MTQLEDLIKRALVCGVLEASAVSAASSAWRSSSAVVTLGRADEQVGETYLINRDDVVQIVVQGTRQIRSTVTHADLFKFASDAEGVLTIFLVRSTFAVQVPTICPPRRRIE